MPRVHSNILRDPTPRVWDDFVHAHGGHLLQTRAWGALKARFGWRAERVLLLSNDAPIAGAQMLFRRLPLGLTFAYIPRGPIADDPATFGALANALAAISAAHGAFTLKIEPNTPSPPFAFPTERTFIPSRPIQPQTTIHVDLTRDLDAILAQMKPKWRYNIRLAERKGVTVRAGNASDVPLFYQLLQLTSARDRFAIHSTDYYRAAIELLSADERARLFIAEYAGEMIAAIFVTAVGDEAIYLYGASGNAHRDKMPNHALHWSAIQWAKARACTRYDLWGIADTAWAEVDEHPERSAVGVQSPDASPMPHGLYRFKQGFGGQVVRYAGAYDVVFSRTKYWLYQRALAARRSLS
jgi:lipid II:glycine glycyltransferase (peptidoglycan interpeptide bridge formation enzyme)